MDEPTAPLTPAEPIVPADVAKRGRGTGTGAAPDGGPAPVSLRDARLAALTRIRDARMAPALSRALPIDPWRLVSRRFSLESPAEAETLFAIANGYICLLYTSDAADE